MICALDQNASRENLSISVIVPCHNSEKVLPRCLDGLLRQTIIDKMEIIVVNDASEDNTASVALQYQQGHKNIQLLSARGRGTSQARRTGVMQACGKYVGFCDSDDWADPCMYEKLLMCVESQHADIACCGVSVETEQSAETLRDRRVTDEATSVETMSGEQALILLHKRQRVFPYMVNKLYRIELFDKIDFPEGIFVGEDYAANVQLMAKAHCVAELRTALYHYIRTEGSTSLRGYSDASIQAFESYKKNEAELKQKFPEQKMLFENYAIIEYLAIMVAMTRNTVYNKKMQKAIQHAVRNGLLKLLKAEYVDRKFKVSAVVVAVSTGLFDLLIKLAGVC